MKVNLCNTQNLLFSVPLFSSNLPEIDLKSTRLNCEDLQDPLAPSCIFISFSLFKPIQVSHEQMKEKNSRGNNRFTEIY